jgi:hypothetical protein
MKRSKNIFDMIGSLIPGYCGYAEREDRRQCDKILRDQISTTIDYYEKAIKKQIENKIDSNNLTQSRSLEICRKKLNTLSSKIKYAPYGESAFFSNLQLKEEELLEIYNKDLKITDIVNGIKESILNANPDNILSIIDNIEQLIDNRNQYIKEYK